MLSQGFQQAQQMVGAGALQAVMLTAAQRAHNVGQEAGGAAEAAVLQGGRAEAVQGLCQPDLTHDSSIEIWYCKYIHSTGQIPVPVSVQSEAGPGETALFGQRSPSLLPMGLR